MSVNQAAPNRGQGKGRKGAKAAPASEAESRTIDHSFVLAVLAAVKAAQVRHQKFLFKNRWLHFSFAWCIFSILIRGFAKYQSYSCVFWVHAMLSLFMLTMPCICVMFMLSSLTVWTAAMRCTDALTQHILCASSICCCITLLTQKMSDLQVCTCQPEHLPCCLTSVHRCCDRSMSRWLGWLLHWLYSVGKSARPQAAWAQSS